MHVPLLREGVQIEGSSGVFLVVAVDYDRQVADLLPTSDGLEELIEDVPFRKILALDEEEYRARVRPAAQD